MWVCKFCLNVVVVVEVVIVVEVVVVVVVKTLGFSRGADVVDIIVVAIIFIDDVLLLFSLWPLKLLLFCLCCCCYCFVFFVVVKILGKMKEVGF